MRSCRRNAGYHGQCTFSTQCTRHPVQMVLNEEGEGSKTGEGGGRREEGERRKKEKWVKHIRQ